MLGSYSKACIVLAICLVASTAEASPSAAATGEPSSADRIEAMQTRAWIKRGSVALEPLGSYAFNDPFLVRGGGGLRAIWWPRSLVGITLEGSAWGQAPSVDAIVAQRELRAQLRPTGSSWLALAGAEIAAADGKIAVGSGILPFEVLLRLGVGAASSRDAATSAPSLALSAGLGARWFLTNRLGIDTSFTWRSTAITRQISGALVPARDTAISFELGIPFRLGGHP